MSRISAAQKESIAAQLRESGFLADIAEELGGYYYEQWRQHIDQRERIGIAHDVLDDIMNQIMNYAMTGEIRAAERPEESKTAGDS